MPLVGDSQEFSSTTEGELVLQTKKVTRWRKVNPSFLQFPAPGRKRWTISRHPHLQQGCFLIGATWGLSGAPRPFFSNTSRLPTHKVKAKRNQKPLSKRQASGSRSYWKVPGPWRGSRRDDHSSIAWSSQDALRDSHARNYFLRGKLNFSTKRRHRTKAEKVSPRTTAAGCAALPCFPQTLKGAQRPEEEERSGLKRGGPWGRPRPHHGPAGAPGGPSIAGGSGPRR